MGGSVPVLVISYRCVIVPEQLLTKQTYSCGTRNPCMLSVVLTVLEQVEVLSAKRKADQRAATARLAALSKPVL